MNFAGRARADAGRSGQAREISARLEVGRVVRVDLGGAFDALRDAAGERARGGAGRSRPSTSWRLRSFGMMESLHADDAERDRPSSQCWYRMKHIAVSAWPPRKSGVISASPMKPPKRLDLVLDHGRHLGGLHAPEAREREAQDEIDRLKRRRRIMRSPIQPFIVLI